MRSVAQFPVPLPRRHCGKAVPTRDLELILSTDTDCRVRQSTALPTHGLFRANPGTDILDPGNSGFPVLDFRIIDRGDHGFAQSGAAS
jgi:hypothetical protein